MNIHDTYEELIEAEHADILLMYAAGEWWMAFQNEVGDWLAVRPRQDDDGPGPDGDLWRPVGPVDLEMAEGSSLFPVQVIPLCEVATLREQLVAAQAEAKRLDEQNTDLSWEVNPDRMGQ